MKHLKKYNESKKSKPFDKGDLELIFAHTFDLCEDHGIHEIYIDPNDDDNWASNDFSNKDLEWHPDKCDIGYMINIDILPMVEIGDLKAHIDIVNELDTDLNRFIGMYNPTFVKFDQDIFQVIVIKP